MRPLQSYQQKVSNDFPGVTAYYYNFDSKSLGKNDTFDSVFSGVSNLTTQWQVPSFGCLGNYHKLAFGLCETDAMPKFVNGTANVSYPTYYIVDKYSGRTLEMQQNFMLNLQYFNDGFLYAPEFVSTACGKFFPLVNSLKIGTMPSSSVKQLVGY